MRRAKADDYWKGVYKGAYNTRLDAVNFENVLTIGDGTLHLGGGITAICGGNGVGKTTLLQAIFTSLKSEIERESQLSPVKFSNANLTATLTISNAQIER